MSTRIVTPDQRLRVFVSSTLGELAPERAAVRRAVEALHLTPVMFELGARPHPPRELYRAYLDQSHVFVGIYWQRYGWVAPGEDVSGLEDEYRLAGDRPRLLYLKAPADDREERLDELIAAFQSDDLASYRTFTTAEELAGLVADDLAVLLSERFAAEAAAGRGDAAPGPAARQLPVPLTETVGRSGEVAEVVALLEGGRRLVTLTGPGGVGKSRLALEAARALRADRDATHLVALASVRSSDAMLRIVADRLGVPVGDLPPAEALAAAVAGRRALLVLDNLEQIDGAGPAVADLLERSPDLQVIATSRQALRVRGEWEQPVAPLPVPTVDALDDDVRTNPAVNLFAARAAEVSRRPVLASGELDTVAEIARRLDGLPLAIELVASQVRFLPPAALLEHLDPLDVPGAAAGDRPERQQTMRATLEWSHDLLGPDEQALLARLGVFAGGFTLDAVAAVAGLPQADDDTDVLAMLASLLDKSLVAADQDEIDATPRFKLLEVVRAYALERLDERGEADELRRRHLAWVRAIAHEAKPGLCGPGQTDWVAAMAPERANLHRAVETAFEIGDVTAVVELAWDVVVLYFVRDNVGEPASWLRRANEAIRADPGGAGCDEVTVAKARSMWALTRIHHGDYDGVRADLREPLEVFRRHGMDFETAVVLHQVGFVRYRLDDDPAGAAAALEESSRLFDSIGHDWGVGLAEAMLGSLQAALGDLPEARVHQERSLARARRIASDQQEAQALGQLALVALLEERYDEALAHLADAAPILRRGHLRTDCANALDALAVVAHQRGERAAAARAVAIAQAERARLGIEPWPTLRPFIDRITRWVAGSGAGTEAGTDVEATVAATDPFGVLASSLAALAADASTSTGYVRAVPGGSPDATSPSWIARLLELERDGDVFVAREPAGSNMSGRLFGGLVAAQSLTAAAATVEGAAKLPQSLHAYFVRGGKPDVDVELIVERTRDGRSFDTRRVTAVQSGEVILEMLASFHVVEPGADAHPPPPPMPPVEECVALEVGGGPDRFEMRAPTKQTMFTGPPHWVRMVDPIEDDPMVRACALTYVSDMGLMAAARPPDTKLTFGPGTVAASLDHTIWFHRPYVPDRWHCYHASPLNSVGARGLALGGLYDENGVLVATMAQEALWRLRPG